MCKVIQIKNNIKGAKTEEKQLQEYLSTFDFESFEIQETDKAFIIQKEEVFNKYGRVYANSLYEICIALSEVSDRLKNNNEIGFAAWYKHIGLNKDKVSALLKRAQLYIDFPEHQAFISSLSGLAVRIITKKEISSANQKQLLENKITAVKDIKEILNINSDDEVIKISNNFRYFNPNTLNKLKKNLITMDSKEISSAKKEIEYYKKMLREVEKELEIKEKEYENKDNLKLVDNTSIEDTLKDLGFLTLHSEKSIEMHKFISVSGDKNNFKVIYIAKKKSIKIIVDSNISDVLNLDKDNVKYYNPGMHKWIESFKKDIGNFNVKFINK